MAAYELNRNWATRFCEFYIDNSSDTELLPTSKKFGSGDLATSTPCSIGSIARDMTGKQYVLNGNDEWVTFATVLSYDETCIATNDEVDSMLNDVF